MQKSDKFLIWVWVPLVPSCIHLRFVDGLGCPSMNRKYRDRDHRITTRRVRLATLSRTWPHGLDESLSADRVHRHHLALDGTDDQTIELTSASVAWRKRARRHLRTPPAANAIVPPALGRDDPRNSDVANALMSSARAFPTKPVVRGSATRGPQFAGASDVPRKRECFQAERSLPETPRVRPCGGLRGRLGFVSHLAEGPLQLAVDAGEHVVCYQAG